MSAINDEIRSRRLIQTQVAALLNINQPKVSALMNYKLDGYSVERLILFLARLGRNIDIVVRGKPSETIGQISVTRLRRDPKHRQGVGHGRA